MAQTQADETETERLRYPSEQHDLTAVYVRDPENPNNSMRVIDDDGETVATVPVTRNNLGYPLVALQFRAKAVGFFNQLQTERKRLGLMAYHKSDPGTDEYVKGREEKATTAIEAAVENHEWA